MKKQELITAKNLLLVICFFNIALIIGALFENKENLLQWQQIALLGLAYAAYKAIRVFNTLTEKEPLPLFMVFFGGVAFALIEGLTLLLEEQCRLSTSSTIFLLEGLVGTLLAIQQKIKNPA